MPCTRTGLLLGRPARRPRIASHNDAAQHGGLTTTLAGCCTNTLGRHSAEGLAGDSQFKVTLWLGHQSGRRFHNRFRLAYNRPTQRHVVHGELRTDMTGRTLHMLTKEAWLVVQQVVLWRTVLPPVSSLEPRRNLSCLKRQQQQTQTVLWWLTLRTAGHTGKVWQPTDPAGPAVAESASRDDRAYRWSLKTTDNRRQGIRVGPAISGPCLCR